ncbi:uncharacterized protein [Cicer arietinum]|uniref:Protein PELPK1-like n=1 Tax=Cicer arietinum TaxID=3827 RepID=A0A1S2Z1D3_CICAR|nr:protein PELPK1-like [Cicer arietinum]
MDSINFWSFILPLLLITFSSMTNVEGARDLQKVVEVFKVELPPLPTLPLPLIEPQLPPIPNLGVPIPDIPVVPTIPQIPQIPTVPQIPQIPKPELPIVPKP